MFKGTTSLGMCVSFILDSKNVSYMDQLIIQFVLYAVGLLCLFSIIWFCVKETNYFLEENVIVPHKFEEKLLLEGMVVQDVIEREKAKEELAAHEVAVEKGEKYDNDSQEVV
jgi:hypothetical protein